MGKVKEEYVKRLEHDVGFAMKHCDMDDQLAHWLLHECTFEEAQEWMDNYWAKGDFAAEAQMEQEAEEVMLEEGRERDHERKS